MELQWLVPFSTYMSVFEPFRTPEYSLMHYANDKNNLNHRNRHFEYIWIQSLILEI